MHQATERYYHSAGLVFTGYKQRTHDIELVGNLAGEQHLLMAGVLPKMEPEENHLFDLLKRAYINARYSMSYRISSAELATLQAQVLVLAARTRSMFGKNSALTRVLSALVREAALITRNATALTT